MRKPSRRLLPAIIGVSVVTTLVADAAVLVARMDAGRASKESSGPAQLVAAADSSTVSNVDMEAVAPLRQQITPDLLIAAPATIPAAVLDQLHRTKGVKSVEVIDAVQAKVGDKMIGLIGVNPSTFRAYTPQPTAQSDSLWRNVAAGDVAVSFSLGNDGGVPLGTTLPIAGKTRQVQARVGAFATMGISDIDGVVSHGIAQHIGMPNGNAVLISAPKADIDQLNAELTKKLLPKNTKTVVLHPKLDFTGGAIKQLTAGRGTFMTAEQINVAIRAGMSKIGLPYIWGGTGPNGYDCSGLVQYALGVAGIRMPRVAADQARTGPILPYNQAQVGDLLIWANDPTNPGYIDHIAIYLGDGKMLVAPHTGDFVKIAYVYTNNLRGVVRVNPAQAASTAG